jgi:hypothetical protein
MIATLEHFPAKWMLLCRRNCVTINKLEHGPSLLGQIMLSYPRNTRLSWHQIVGLRLGIGQMSISLVAGRIVSRRLGLQRG